MVVMGAISEARAESGAALMGRRIAIAGGAGYVGSHIAVELLTSTTGHYEVALLDNLSNSSMEVIARIESICHRRVRLIRIDLTDAIALAACFADHQFDAVIHCAALKSTVDSIANPLQYYHNNLLCTINLLRSMAAADIHTIIFSSSATVYGSNDGASRPLIESDLTAPSTPYGRTKLCSEAILQDCAAADAHLSVVILRYFNPIGAHQSGQIGENPPAVPGTGNIMPNLCQAAIGAHTMNVFGDDFATNDGSAVRDYVHVLDVARAHECALRSVGDGGRLSAGQAHVFNIGTGQGKSVFELLQLMGEAAGAEIPCSIQERRAGDVHSLVANVDKAEAELLWRATHTIHQACHDALNWQIRNPEGFKSKITSTSSTI